ncbi:MAG TPA: phosphoserine phosphatase [Clostridiales bacterium]|nr:phosphoserine phosphatase [Clostridiales bacterium]
MNGYDFDKTIYDGDSTVDFYLYSIRRHPGVLRALPRTAAAGLAYILGLRRKTAFKQTFYRFLRYIPDIDDAVADFWDAHRHKIKDCYLERKRPDDIIISASPEFLLAPVCRDAVLIASRVHPKTGLYTGENCFGPEKVVRLMEQCPGCTFEEFYSDSLSDTPLADLAERAYLVTGTACRLWPR